MQSLYKVCTQPATTCQRCKKLAKSMLKHGNTVKSTLEHANAATSMQKSMQKRAGAAKIL